MSTASDFLLFAATAALMTLNQRGIVGASPLPDAAKTCDADALKNSAFVFVKPQANTPATQALVKSKLTEAGITILSEADIDGTVIDEKKLIDQHYFAIASKATILPAKDIPVPTAKFQETFGESWQQVLDEDRACNAMDACKRFACSAVELNDAWQKAQVVKFGGGFYCGTTKMKTKIANIVGKSRCSGLGRCWRFELCATSRPKLTHHHVTHCALFSPFFGTLLIP
jgi:hypothetical protein